MTTRTRAAASKAAEPIIPPQSHEAEVSVLGATLQDATAAEKVCNLLQSSDFYTDQHAHIFAAVRVLGGTLFPRLTY